MQNLYDLLGVCPKDDAESLRRAYRKAAMESHPDHHGGDPEAAMRFRRVTEAYDTLRDAERRAAYDQLLEFERRPFRWKLRRAVFDVKRHIVQDVTAGAVLAVVLAVGYELYAGMSRASVDQGLGITAVIRAGQSTATPQMPVLIPTVVVSPAAADAGRDGEPDIIPVATAGPGESWESPEAAPAEDRHAPSPDLSLSAAEKHDGAPNPSLLVPAFDDRRDSREPGHASAGDVKQLAGMRVPAQPPAVNGHAASRPPVDPSSPGIRPDCADAQSCSGDILPLFGLGP